MVRNRGGLLASVGLVAIAASRFASFGRVAEGEGAGGGGGAAVVEEDDFFADPAGAGGGAPAPTAEEEAAAAAAAAAAGAEGGAAEIPEWVKSFSGDKPKEGELSNQEWIAKLGVKDLDGLATIARDNQKALRESGRVKVPGEGATEAELKSFREAVGAPLEPTGYEIALPEGADGFELDTALIDAFRPIAHKWNIPAAAFKELGGALLASQLEGFQGEHATHGADKAAKLVEWGKTGDVEQAKAEFKRGQQFLNLKVGDIQKIQIGFGAGATMDLLRTIGQRAGEDFFAGNGNGALASFGYSDLASAEKALNDMIGDKETAAKIRAKDPVTVQRYNGLTKAVAAFREQASRGSR
jgi:hypothetical protein